MKCPDCGVELKCPSCVPALPEEAGLAWGVIKDGGVSIITCSVVWWMLEKEIRELKQEIIELEDDLHWC